MSRSPIDPALLPSSSWPANNIYCCCCLYWVVRLGVATWEENHRIVSAGLIRPEKSREPLRPQVSVFWAVGRGSGRGSGSGSGSGRGRALPSISQPLEGANAARSQTADERRADRATRPRGSCGKFVNKVADRRGFALIAKWMCEVNVRGDRVKYEHIILQANEIESFR